MRCECECCKHHADRCENHEGQLSLFDDSTVSLVEYGGAKLCAQCLPKPPALPVDYHYSKREAQRLAKQETLFLFL